MAAALLVTVWSTSNWHQKVVALMEAAAKEAEAAHIPGGVWVWLPDRRCLVDQHVVAIYLLFIAQRIRCQKACNRLATHPLRAFLKASRAQVRWCFAEASNAV